MKQLTAAIFLLAFTALTFSKAVVYIDFYANQKYIAQNLCINKAKPKMHCSGKCQLAKKITDDEANKDKQNSGSKNENRIEMFSPESFSAVTGCYNKFIIKVFPPFHLNKCIDRTFEIFHPPGV